MTIISYEDNDDNIFPVDGRLKQSDVQVVTWINSYSHSESPFLNVKGCCIAPELTYSGYN